MEIEEALRRAGGIAPMRDLRRFGINRDIIWGAIRAKRVVRVRNGWIALLTTSPLEIRAVEEYGLLTCSSAANVYGFPSAGAHLHIRSRNQKATVQRGTRRITPKRIGACVDYVEMTLDYLECQAPEWSLALVDYLERNRLLSNSEWSMVANRASQKSGKVIAMRSPIPESPLESIARWKLARAKIPYVMQHQIGSFRVDFVVGRALIMEVHGQQFHASPENWEKDKKRVAALRAQGWDVLEFSFEQITNSWKSVELAIRAASFRQPKAHHTSF